jgi:transcriptional regulator with XRE-family HTH domain
MEVGHELAEARRRLGFSLEDISHRTKVSVERLSAIEHGVVQELPPLVYLSGFLRAYAAEVQLDGSDITKRYLAELEQMTPPPTVDADLPLRARHDPVDEAESTAPSDSAGQESPREMPTVRELPPQPAPQRAAHEEQPAVEIERPPEPEFDSEPDAEPALQSRRASYFDAGFDPESERQSSRMFAVAPLDDQEGTARERSAHLGANPPQRLGALLAVVAVSVIVGIVLSANLDLVTSQVEDWWKRAVRTTSTDTKKTDRTDDGSGSAQPKSEPVAQPVERIAPSAAAPTPSEPTQTTASNTRASEGDPKRAAADGNSPAEAATKTVDPIVPESASNTNQASDDEPKDLSGAWTLTNRIESTSHEPYNNLNLGYRLQLAQRGDRVTGTGQKWMENGKALPAAARTPIALEGTRTGRRLDLKFTETGAERISNGTFVLEIAGDGTLQGSFSSDVANTQGSSLARRMVSPRFKSTPINSPRPGSPPSNSPGTSTPSTSTPRKTSPSASSPTASAPKTSSADKSGSPTNSSRTNRPQSNSPHTNVPRTSLLRPSPPRTSSPRQTSPRATPPRPVSPPQ